MTTSDDHREGAPGVLEVGLFSTIDTIKRGYETLRLVAETLLDDDIGGDVIALTHVLEKAHLDTFGMLYSQTNALDRLRRKLCEIYGLDYDAIVNVSKINTDDGYKWRIDMGARDEGQWATVIVDTVEEANKILASWDPIGTVTKVIESPSEDSGGSTYLCCCDSPDGKIHRGYCTYPNLYIEVEDYDNDDDGAELEPWDRAGLPENFE